MLVAQRNEPHVAAILQDMKTLGGTGRVLYVAAHPDDENTRMLAWLANAKGYETAYISLTRGDGGQNLIGSELGEKLGLIRNQELWEARKIDGAKQYFTRAVDFGYSKTAEESFEIWDKEEVMKDLVRVIRKFKPDVIINRFPPDKRAGHGHHTASAILAIEAFDLAADSSIYPDQVATYGTWQAERLYWNTSIWWVKDLDTNLLGTGKLIREDVGEYLPYLGQSAGELASLSRSQHKSQGFGIALFRGQNQEYLEWIKGSQAKKNLMENIQTNWERYGLPEIDKQVKLLISTFNPENPNLSTYKLNELKKIIETKAPEPVRSEKITLINDLILRCNGIYAEALSPKELAAPGDTLELTFNLINQKAVMAFLKNIDGNKRSDILHTNKMFSQKIKSVVPPYYTQPYWLLDSFGGLFQVPDTSYIGQAYPYKHPTIRVELELEGAPIEMEIPIIYKYTDRVKGEMQKALRINPDVSLSFNREVVVLTDEQEVELVLRIDNVHRKNIEKNIVIPPVKGLKIEPSEFTLQMSNEQDVTYQKIKLSSIIPNMSVRLEFKESLDSITQMPLYQVHEINYDHIGSLNLLSQAEIKVNKAQIKIPKLRIAYVAGAGDAVASSLQNLGMDVKMLTDEDLANGNLNAFDVIVCGIRAFNTNTSLIRNQNRLLEYVDQGGRVIVQYNTLDIKVKQIGPYALKLGRTRVTEEDSPVELINPADKLWRSPNVITLSDFEHWVQERGLYFADTWSEEYQPFIRWNDTNEEALEGALLAADYGKGKFIYTGISFFRQLPAGVPGAYKLFINLLYYGQAE